MFLKHFDLAVNPFSMSSGLDFLFKSTAFEEGMAHLIYGLDNSEAIVLITGPIGSGKTMSLQSFLTNLGDQYLFALVTNTKVNHVELLKLIVEDLDIDLEPGWDKSDLLIAFKQYLIKARQNGRKVVVVIDEAQNLSIDVLEEVRLLTNLGQGAEQPVQLILVGQPELKDVVNQPELEQLRQRIRVHYEFEKLSYEEMVGYINHRMAVAGCSRQVFKKEALEKLFEISGGIPRLVNTHAGDALLSAFVAKRSKVDAQDVEEGLYEMKEEHAHVLKEVPIPVAHVKLNASGSGSRRWWSVAALLIILVPVVWFTMFQDEVSLPWADVSEVPVAHVPEPLAISPVINDPVKESKPDGILLAETSVEDTLQAETTPSENTEVVVPVQIPVEPVYFTHVASFRDSLRSSRYLKKFERLSFSGQVKKQDVNGEQWYRLYIGPVATRDSADAVGKYLQGEGATNYYRVVKISGATSPGIQGSVN